MAVKNPPEGTSVLTPYLTVNGAAKAIDFYKKVFGAREKFRMESSKGKIGHAELEIGGCSLMLTDECPDSMSPETVGGTPVMIHLYVNDVDAVFTKALGAGAIQVRPVENQFYGDRSGGIQDPFGHKWWIATHVEDVSEDELKRRHEKMMKEEKKAA
jgi:PhnB protein